MYGFNSLQAQAIIVSVDYHDFLSLTLEANAHHFESLIVATTPQDKKTQSIVSSVPNATCHVTEVFYEKRCSFNKGAAIEECLGLTSRLGWFVLMDADIIMPKEIMLHSMDEQKLYCPYRRILENPSLYESFYKDEKDWVNLYLEDYNGRVTCGYFQLFNSNAKPLQHTPWFPTTVCDAGGSDILFDDKWDMSNKTRIITLQVLHLGKTCENWWGRKSPFFKND
tara:strand:- start:719 stop:1390 length:672 start_codon:yes stop_codon:yes gene_type:complete